MTEVEKQQILDLRQKGVGYKAIVAVIGISSAYFGNIRTPIPVVSGHCNGEVWLNPEKQLSNPIPNQLNHNHSPLQPRQLRYSHHEFLVNYRTGPPFGMPIIYSCFHQH